MTTLFATRSARRRAVAFTVLLSTSVVLMAISSSPLITEFQNAMNYAMRPVQGALHGVAEGISGAVGAIAEIDRLHTDNASLRSENDRLNAENLRAQALEQENEQLSTLLQLQGSFKYKTAAAEVIARESSEVRRTVTLSKGSDDGIAKGDVVIAAGGALVGRVTDVGPNFAMVTLVNDRTSTVIGETETNGAKGDVVGQLGGALIMENIDSTETVKVGEQVLTAGIELPGGIRSPFPKGLLIGEITDVKREASSVVQTAYLQPSVDLDKVTYVLVVLDYVGGLPGANDTPIDCGATGSGTSLPGGEQPCIEPSATPGPGATPLVP